MGPLCSSPESLPLDKQTDLVPEALGERQEARIVDFRELLTYYDTVRPHRALGRRTPMEAFGARTKATPRRAGLTIPTPYRVRRDKIDKAGRVTLRYHSTLLHIGFGRAHSGTRVLLLVADRDVRVITEDGELLQHLTIDPTKNYQPHGRP
jgi:hypothetical protein